MAMPFEGGACTGGELLEMHSVLPRCIGPYMCARRKALLEQEGGAKRTHHFGDGSWYVGDLNPDGKGHGQGTCYSKAGKWFYVGEWLHGRPQGNGYHSEHGHGTWDEGKLVGHPLNQVIADGFKRIRCPYQRMDQNG